MAFLALALTGAGGFLVACFDADFAEVDFFALLEAFPRGGGGGAAGDSALDSAGGRGAGLGFSSTVLSDKSLFRSSKPSCAIGSSD